MKAKYLNLKEELGIKHGDIYNVFSIVNSTKDDWNKFYIKTNGPKYVYPFDIKDFEIVDGSISKTWSKGKDNNGDQITGPKELFEMDNFWWNYYEDVPEYLDVINKYYETDKEELFNEYKISEEEKQERKNRGWEFIE